jgi:hypothetical protein
MGEDADNGFTPLKPLDLHKRNMSVKTPAVKIDNVDDQENSNSRLTHHPIAQNPKESASPVSQVDPRMASNQAV